LLTTAPPKLDLVARNVETDPAFMLLYFALKHTEEGKIKFDKVVTPMGFDTGNAAYVEVPLPEGFLGQALTEIEKSATQVS
jgi:hypothetical protein